MCLLISSLPGKALRMLLDIARLAFSKLSLANLISKYANLGLQADSLFKLAFMTLL